MDLPGFAPFVDAMSAWGPELSAFALILFTAQRAWVAYLKHRGADYVRALGEYAVNQSESAIRMRELIVTERLVDLGYGRLELQRAEPAQQQEGSPIALEPEVPATPAAAKKAA